MKKILRWIQAGGGVLVVVGFTLLVGAGTGWVGPGTRALFVGMMVVGTVLVVLPQLKIYRYNRRLYASQQTSLG